MRNLLTSCILLLLGFGLVAGHLPCQAREDVREAATSGPPAGTACHGPAAPADGVVLRPGSTADDRGCCSSEHGVCQHPCHMVADMGADLPRFVVQTSARELPALVCRSLSLYPQPIDHIPLA